MTKTIKFFASLGVNPGYFHNNASALTETTVTEIVGQVWQEKALEYFNETQRHVGAVISPSKTVYKTEWGCPVGGEDTVLITGECNPAFEKVEFYQEAVKEVLRRTAIELGQTTTQVTFQKAEFHYLKLN
jgi:hypothetical protein